MLKDRGAGVKPGGAAEVTDSPPSSSRAWEQRRELRADPSAISQPCLCHQRAHPHTCSGISLHSSTIRGFSGVVGEDHSDPQTVRGTQNGLVGDVPDPVPCSLQEAPVSPQPCKEASRNPLLPSVCPRKAAQDLRVTEASQRVYMTVVNSQSPLRICRKRGHTIAMALSRVHGASGGAGAGPFCCRPSVRPSPGAQLPTSVFPSCNSSHLVLEAVAHPSLCIGTRGPHTGPQAGAGVRSWECRAGWKW